MKIKVTDSQGNTALEEVENVDFNVDKEDWNVYKLEDGTTLRIKLVVGKILKSKERRADTGEPIYRVQSQNIVTADVPEDLVTEPN